MLVLGATTGLGMQRLEVPAQQCSDPNRESELLSISAVDGFKANVFRLQSSEEHSFGSIARGVGSTR